MTNGQPANDGVTTVVPAMTPAAPSNLRARLISGAVMAAIALADIWLGGWWFAGMVALIGVVVAWEWGRIVRDGGIDAIFLFQAIGVLGAVVLTAFGAAGLGAICIIVACLASGLLAFGSGGLMAALGALYAGLPAIALVWLRGSTDDGLLAVLLLILVVVTTDTMAYMTGRTLGGPKLMPRVSPNKTWSGLIGGVGAAALAALMFGFAVNGRLMPGMALLGLVLGLVAQAGDLMESSVKRAYGVKDASSLIPGHGGFMDRVDGLVLAAVAAALFGMIVDIHAPARVLLNGSW